MLASAIAFGVGSAWITAPQYQSRDPFASRQRHELTAPL